MTTANNVPVKSAWLSKINWTALISPVISSIVVADPASILQTLGVEADPQTKLMLVFGIQAVQSGLTWLWRTYFNNSVAPTAG